MRKMIAKIALHKETVRALSSMKLARVVGGQETDAGLAIEMTQKKTCPAPP